MSDDAMYPILRRAQQTLTCPVCRRKFKLDELKVRAVLDRQFLIQASCHASHAPALVLFIASGTTTTSGTQVTADDVIDLHRTLKDFDGDFRSAFKALDQKKQ